MTLVVKANFNAGINYSKGVPAAERSPCPLDTENSLKSYSPFRLSRYPKIPPIAAFRTFEVIS
jgi:hypothetical protein